MSLSLKAVRYGKWLIAFLLAIEAALAFPAGNPQAFPAAGRHQAPPIPLPASLLSIATTPQVESTEEKGAGATRAGLEAIQTAVEQVRTPGLQTLAGALGLSSVQIGQQAFEDSNFGMEPISGLGDSGLPAVAVKWRPADAGQDAQPEREPNLYLLSWDGKGWQASYLTPATDALTLHVLPVTGSTAPLFAVIIFRGITAAPYPVIFQYGNHHASLVWDGRSDSSLYAGYDYGSIQFEKAGSGDIPVMIVTGRADPGLLVFPASSDQAGRGFPVATVYAWQNGAYVPIRTEYTHNRDYTIYRFIAALHLHDFKTAYALIDPKQFLKTDKPSLILFRERILNAWPEFTDDRIFEIPAGLENGSGSHLFILNLGDGKMNVYHPTFTEGPEYRLTGLERTESSE